MNEAEYRTYLEPIEEENRKQRGLILDLLAKVERLEVLLLDQRNHEDVHDLFNEIESEHCIRNVHFRRYTGAFNRRNAQELSYENGT